MSKQKKYKAIIEIRISKEDYKMSYTLRSRIGITIGRILQLINIEWI